MNKIKWKPLLISLAISFGTGGISALLTSDSMEQYQNLYQPPLAPPGWVFPVVWTILFVLMGIASYLVYISSEGDVRRTALQLYGIQLVANVGWSLIFFRFNRYLPAFAWLLLLWFLIFLTTREFYKINKTAGRLMLPYLLWVTFAGYLNLAIAIYYNF